MKKNILKLVIKIQYLKKVIFNKFKFLNLPYHYLRYKLFVKKKFNITANINFDYKGSSKSTLFFKEELKKHKIVLEFGSGSSTLLYDDLKINFISIENDKSFYHYMKNKLINKSLIYHDFGPTYYYGKPVLFYFRKKILSNVAKNFASNSILKLLEKNIDNPLIFADGRYRVLVCLYVYKFFSCSNLNFTLVIDDYVDRDYYFILENYFYIKKVGRFAVSSSIKFVEMSEVNTQIELFSFDYR
jgi:hypothetical protein